MTSAIGSTSPQSDGAAARARRSAIWCTPAVPRRKPVGSTRPQGVIQDEPPDLTSARARTTALGRRVRVPLWLGSASCGPSGPARKSGEVATASGSFAAADPRGSWVGSAINGPSRRPPNLRPGMPAVGQSPAALGQCPSSPRIGAKADMTREGDRVIEPVMLCRPPGSKTHGEPFCALDGTGERRVQAQVTCAANR